MGGELMFQIPGNEIPNHPTGTDFLFPGNQDPLWDKNTRQFIPDKGQLHTFMSVLGKPDAEFINCVQNKEMRYWLREQRGTPRQTLEQKFPKVSEDCLDLLRGMLQYDPRHRLTVEQCLQHPWFSDCEIMNDPNNR